VHKSTVLELDDDNFEIQEIREIQEENTWAQASDALN
jgi:hypothetical protein